MSDELTPEVQPEGTEEVTPEIQDVTPDPEEDGIGKLSAGWDSIFTDETDEPGEESGEKPEAAPETEVEGQEEIPQEQVDIARQLGYSDAEIVKLAEDSPQVLANMVKRFAAPQREAVPQREEKPTVPPAEEPKPFEVAGLDKLPPEVQAVLNPLVERLQAQDAELHKLKGVSEQADQVKQEAFNRKIDTYFDSIHDELPDVGKEKPTEAQTTTRMEIYGIAHMLTQTRGMELEKALDEASYMWALSKYDLGTLEKQAEDRVRGDLVKHKQKMSPRPGGRQTEKKYNSVEEEMLDTLSQGMKGLFE